VSAIGKAGYTAGTDVMLGLDCAATEFFKDGNYVYGGENKTRPRSEQANISPTSSRAIRIVTVEGRHVRGMTWMAWKELTDLIGNKCQLVGDDLFVNQRHKACRRYQEWPRQFDPDQGQPDRHADGNAERGRDGLPRPAYTAVMSHRSGETEDFHYRRPRGLPTNCGQIKNRLAGPRSDRNRQVQPAASASNSNWGAQAKYAGEGARLEGAGVRLGRKASA